MVNGESGMSGTVSSYVEDQTRPGIGTVNTGMGSIYISLFGVKSFNDHCMVILYIL